MQPEFRAGDFSFFSLTHLLLLLFADRLIEGFFQFHSTNKVRAEDFLLFIFYNCGCQLFTVKSDTSGN